MTLDSIADNLVRGSTGPAYDRAVEALTDPPFRIFSCCMHGQLVSARKRLAALIRSHEQTLTMRGSCSMEIELGFIRLVVREPVLVDAPLLFGQEALLKRGGFIRAQA